MKCKKWFIENFGIRPSELSIKTLQIKWLKARDQEMKCSALYEATKKWDRDYELVSNAVKQVEI